jgi:hypothetical protein
MNGFHASSQPPAARQVLLGIFIVGQLFFLLTSNLIGFLKDKRTELGPGPRQAAEALAPGWPEEKGHLWHALEHLTKTDKMWAETTGQFQIWSLFAPTIGRECVFPAVELRWDDDAEPELLLSEQEPVNLESYFRVGKFRMRRYENMLVITLRPEADETPEKTRERWSEAIHSHVADYADIIQGYLRWRVGQAAARRPGRPPPRQMILQFRRYYINDYDKAPPYWQGPFIVPVARWQPAMARDATHQPLEWYDPAVQHFKSLRQ